MPDRDAFVITRIAGGPFLLRAGARARVKVWHPNTQMSEWPQFDRIVHGKGMWLYDSRGRGMLDGVASMWCNVWGHGEPELVGAICRQAKVLQHSPLFNLTHGPAERLASRLVGALPGMRSVSFSESGSAAVEIALKMAIQYWRNEGRRGRITVASLTGGYHGDTFGAMSAGYSDFFSSFAGHRIPVRRLPAPADSSVQESLAAVEAASKDASVLLMESGIQMAGGARAYPRGFQSAVRRICRKAGALLVLDEVASGLGRMGGMACYQGLGGAPDIAVYGKSLTGGYLPMAATLASGRVYRSFLGSYGSKRHLFHGHTYTGNPVAAACADKNLQLYARRRLLGRVARSARAMAAAVPEFLADGVLGARQAGMVLAVDLAPGRGGVSANRQVYLAGRRRGIYLRTLGDTVLLVPPLAVGRAELDMMLERALRTVRDVARARIKSG